MLSWLRDVPRKLRRRKKERFIKALERQLDEMYDADAPPAMIEAKRAAILRARSELSTLLMACMLLGCQHVSAQDALEVAVIGAQETRLACQAELAHLDGDTSTGAVQARRDCLKMPALESTRDATEAMAYEIEAARKWTVTGAK